MWLLPELAAFTIVLAAFPVPRWVVAVPLGTWAILYCLGCLISYLFDKWSAKDEWWVER